MSTALRAALARAVNRTDDVRVNLVLSASMEARHDEIVDLAGVCFNRVSLETQQIDAHVSKVVEQAIAEATAPKAIPTVPTVYVVGAQSLQEGNPDDQATLRAAVQDRIENSADVILALLPAETAAEVEAAEAAAECTESEDEQAVADRSGIIEAAKQFVSTVDVPVVESMEALQEYLTANVD